MSRSSAVGAGPYTAAVGKAVLEYDRTSVTRNTASEPSARRTYTRRPRRSMRSRKNTPGAVSESMWPTITAAPIAPGRELPVYQPATEVLAGTCRAPEAVSPRRTSPLRTPIDGMMRPVGGGTGRAVGGGAAAWRPSGNGTSVGGPAATAGRPVRLARASP